MPEIAVLEQVMNLGVAGILAFIVWRLWIAYQFSIAQHIADLRNEANEDKATTRTD